MLKTFTRMALYELVYVSLATRPLDTAELTAMLEEARVFNAEHGITGLLVYHGQEFIQLLEGDEAEVKALFERICHDPRHGQVYVMWEAPLDARSFDQWAMGFVATEDAELIGRPAYVELRAERLLALGLQATRGRSLIGLLRQDLLAAAQTRQRAQSPGR